MICCTAMTGRCWKRGSSSASAWRSRCQSGSGWGGWAMSQLAEEMATGLQPDYIARTTTTGINVSRQPYWSQLISTSTAGIPAKYGCASPHPLNYDERRAPCPLISPDDDDDAMTAIARLLRRRRRRRDCLSLSSSPSSPSHFHLGVFSLGVRNPTRPTWR